MDNKDERENKNIAFGNEVKIQEEAELLIRIVCLKPSSNNNFLILLI